MLQKSRSCFFLAHKLTKSITLGNSCFFQYFTMCYKLINPFHGTGHYLYPSKKNQRDCCMKWVNSVQGIKQTQNNSNSGLTNIQKQPSWGVLRERCSDNMQQINRRTPMPKYDFNNVALHLFIRTPLEGCFWIFMEIYE